MEDKQIRKFMELVSRLEAVEFIGLCKFLGVKLMEENCESAPSTPDNNEIEEVKVGEEVEVRVEEEVEVGVDSARSKNCAKPRDFTDLFPDLVLKFSKLSRPRKRELIKILGKLNK